MNSYKIILLQNKCIGCGACMFSNSKYYKMEQNGKSILKNSDKMKNYEFHLKLEEDYNLNLKSSKCCPVNCIKIEINNNNFS